MKCAGKCENVKLQMGTIFSNQTCLLLKWEDVMSFLSKIVANIRSGYNVFQGVIHELQ
jgi:hypothetical protein